MTDQVEEQDLFLLDTVAEKYFNSLHCGSTSCCCSGNQTEADQRDGKVHMKTESLTQHGVEEKTVSRGNVLGEFGVLEERRAT
jgi:hypothetical protein